MNTQPVVAVGLSGGVDSSVAALRLKQQGYRVIGVFIKVWHPDFMVCNWEQERLDAMRVAARLEIPFLTCDAVTAYHDAVAQEFIAEYEAGRTPNPDILCNRCVKFGAFLDFAVQHGADYIATGHYAQRIDTTTGPTLHRGHDSAKDQSYFLWSLTETQLSQSLFPVGDTSKPEIRAEAEVSQLITAAKRDSQGICFLGHVDIPEFLRHYFPLTPGVVLDTNGAIIGHHRDARVYTIGQRHGFTITTHDAARTPYYVIARDMEANTITVAPTRPTWTVGTRLTLTKVITRHTLVPGTTYAAQCRYRQVPFGVRIVTATEAVITIELLETVEQAAPGQSCVLYDESVCIGGGMIA